MKNLMHLIILNLFTFCFAVFALQAQELPTNSSVSAFSNNFDEYLVGEISAQADCWNTWSGGQNATEDGLVREYVGNKYLSLHKGGNQDVVLGLGDRTSGKYELTFYIWLFKGDRGYFNILHTFNPGGYQDDEWAQDVYFEGNGKGKLRTGGSNYSFTYGQDKWVKVKQQFDLDNNVTQLYIDGKLIKKWPFSYQAKATYGSKELSGLNFYPIKENYEFYVDNITFQKVNTFSIDQKSTNEELINLPAPFNETVTVAQTINLTDNKDAEPNIFPVPAKR